jgi:acyl-CoA synthetase (AMP-forming)/AMP-acid ligase II
MTTMPDRVAALAAEAPERDAIVGPDGRVTYGRLLEDCRALAGFFAAAGLAPGDRVGVLMPNSVRAVTLMLAGQWAGLTVIPVNTWYRSTELAYVIETGRLRMLMADPLVFGHDIAADLAEAEFDAAAFLGTTYLPPGAAVTDLADGAAPLRDCAATADGIGQLLFTSGSTAKPKPVPLRNGNLVRNGWEIGARQHLRPGDRIWFSAPFFFGYGCCNALPVALAHGATLCMEERVSEASLAFIEDERCTVYYGLATATRLLLGAPRLGQHDLSSLRTGTTGFTAEDKRLAIEELGVREVCSVYGLTEAYGHSTMTDARDPLEVKLHTQGTVLPTQELRIVDDAGRECAPREPGEVQLRGCVADGYDESPELDAVAYTTDGWLRTGDLGFVDEHRRLHFVGRLKEMLKVKGINVAPAEVEQVVVEHAGVDQVFVVGYRDGAGEEAIGCAVVPRAPVDDRERFTADLVHHIRRNAASYKVPARFLLLANEHLPTTDTGKVSKLLLREMLEEARDA